MKLKRLVERRPNEAHKERTIIYYCCPAKVLCVYRTAIKKYATRTIKMVHFRICYENN